MHLVEETEAHFGRQLWFFEAIGVDTFGRRHVLHLGVQRRIHHLEASSVRSNSSGRGSAVQTSHRHRANTARPRPGWGENAQRPAGCAHFISFNAPVVGQL